MFPKTAISTAWAAGYIWLRHTSLSSGFLPTGLLLENLRLSRSTETETQAPSQPATVVFHLSFGSQQVSFSEKVAEDIIQHFLKLKY